MNEFLLSNWEKLIWTPIVGITVWYFTKRNLQKSAEAKAEAAVTKENLGNITSNFEVYQNLINDLEIRFQKRIEELETDLDKMKLLNEELRGAVARQERYINTLLIKIDNYESKKK